MVGMRSMHVTHVMTVSCVMHVYVHALMSVRMSACPPAYMYARCMHVAFVSFDRRFVPYTKQIGKSLCEWARQLPVVRAEHHEHANASFAELLVNFMP